MVKKVQGIREYLLTKSKNRSFKSYFKPFSHNDSSLSGYLVSSDIKVLVFLNREFKIYWVEFTAI